MGGIACGGVGISGGAGVATAREGRGVLVTRPPGVRGRVGFVFMGAGGWAQADDGRRGPPRVTVWGGGHALGVVLTAAGGTGSPRRKAASDYAQEPQISGPRAWFSPAVWGEGAGKERRAPARLGGCLLGAGITLALLLVLVRQRIGCWRSPPTPSRAGARRSDRARPRPTSCRRKRSPNRSPSCPGRSNAPTWRAPGLLPSLL